MGTRDAPAYRYTVTLNCRCHAGNIVDDSKSETFEVDVCNETCSGMVNLLSLKSLALQEVSSFDVRRECRKKEIVGLWQNPAGSACSCRLLTGKDVNAVQRLAAAGGAKALFVLRRPTVTSDQMPVFLVRAAIHSPVWTCLRATVSLQRHELNPVSSSDQGGMDVAMRTEESLTPRQMATDPPQVSDVALSANVVMNEFSFLPNERVETKLTI